jgi:hypothetical protein
MLRFLISEKVSNSRFSDQRSRYTIGLLAQKLGILRPLPPQVGPDDTKPEMKIDDRAIAQQPTKGQRLTEEEQTPINWTDLTPPAMYHPDFTKRSLDDTPMEFSAEKLGKIRLYDNIKSYCAKKWLKMGKGKEDKVVKSQAVKEILLQDWSLKRLKERLSPRNSCFLTCLI